VIAAGESPARILVREEIMNDNGKGYEIANVQSDIENRKISFDVIIPGLNDAEIAIEERSEIRKFHEDIAKALLEKFLTINKVPCND
jgi:uncharacterized protein YaiI (UPF0178 family)